jgi:hypothetical protein
MKTAKKSSMNDAWTFRWDRFRREMRREINFRLPLGVVVGAVVFQFLLILIAFD